MRFTSQTEKDAHGLQCEIETLQAGMAEAARSGDLALVTELHEQFAGKAAALAEARSKPVVGECRRCGKEVALEEYDEVVVSAIVRHRRGQVPEVEVFERGQERHLIYDLECSEESRLLGYLTKR